MNNIAILTQLFAVFDAVSEWLIGAFESVGAMFWTGENFTWFGTITLVSLGIGVCFLILGVIRAFIRFR